MSLESIKLHLRARLQAKSFEGAGMWSGAARAQMIFIKSFNLIMRLNYFLH